jgi:hypothetical protein
MSCFDQGTSLASCQGRDADLWCSFGGLRIDGVMVFERSHHFGMSIMDLVSHTLVQRPDNARVAKEAQPQRVIM